MKKVNSQKNPEALTQSSISVFKKIAKQYGTPLYVYFEKDLEENLKKFQNIQAPFGLIVRYAIKANSNAAILRLFNKLGSHFDASTFNECVRLIEGAGIVGNKIRLTSQEVQTEDNLKYLRGNGVYYTACSLRQLESYGALFPHSEIAIRFNIGIGSGAFPQVSTGGVNSSFGIYGQREKINALLEKYHLSLTTIHLHIGSGNDSEKQKQAIIEGLKLVSDYPSVTTLNMGGGFKVARVAGEKETDVADMGTAMSQALKDYAKKIGRKLILEIEPGTALVANAAYILTSIVDKVNTGASGKEFLKVNGGMNMNSRIPMYGAQHPMTVIPMHKREHIPTQYVVTGVCCESGDVLTVRSFDPDVIEPRLLLHAEVGDLFVVGGAGAYCASMASLNYNSFPIHPEVLVRMDRTVHVIRERQQLSDIWKYERVPGDLK